MSAKPNIVEDMAADAYREGVSAGAAARELCRDLGVHGGFPTLRRLLEDLLAEANDAAQDRAQILSDFANSAPESAAQARRDSFQRINGR